MANGFPYGDAFLVGTPTLDNLSRQLYAQQRQRELYQQQQNKALNDEFARNMAGIRDADINDLTKAYGEFKMANQNLMRLKHGVSPEMQMDLLRKKAAIYDVINKSKEQKTWEEAQGKNIMTDRKGYYADDAHDQMMKRMKTPVSKLDTSKDGDLLYKYSMPDLNKELKFAEGEQKEVPITLGQSKTDPMKDEKEIYKVGNNPNQFYNNLLQGVVASNKSRNFVGIVNHKYDDNQLDELQAKYNAKITDPKFIAIHGETKPFPELAMSTDLGKAVAIETMEKVVNTPMTPIKKMSEINVDRQTKDRQKFAIDQQERAHKNSLARLYVYASIQDRKPEALAQKIDGLIGQHIADGRDNGGVVAMDDATFEALTGKKRTKTAVVTIDENGNYKYGKYKRNDAGDVTSEIDIEGDVPFELAKTKLTQKYKSGLDGRYNTGDKKPIVPEKTIPSYKAADLKAAGWTDEQIKAAVKAGKIKTN